MRKVLFILFVLSIGILHSCSPYKIIIDHDSDINFNNYSTYNFTPAADSIPLNQLIKRRLFNAISSQMNLNGIKWAAEPDIFVHMHILLKGNTKTNNIIGQNQNFRMDSVFSTTYTDMGEYSMGTLTIDMIDSNRKQMVWTSRASAALKGDIFMSEKDINKLVKKMLKKFPPK